MWHLCCIYSYVLYKLKIFKQGNWGWMYFAICIYSQWDPDKGEKLMDQHFPTFESHEPNSIET